MFNLSQHSPLVIGVFDLLHFHHLRLFEHLDGIIPLIVFGLDQVDSAKTASAESPEDLEILKGVFPLGYTCRILRLGHLLLCLLVLRRMAL